ncbi:MAG: hypothetical protein EBU14_07785 [Acetobacteraceae bacterium]|nr:hypothetical protein [Acetobacteraceae bacterium]
MPYLIEALLFLAPFAAFFIWRRLNPGREPSGVLLVMAACGAALMLAGAVWYGLSRSSAPGSTYVPARIDGNEITPGHMEPRR